MATVNKGFSDAAVEMFGQVVKRAKFVQVNGSGDVPLAKESDVPSAVLFASAALFSTCKYIVVENAGGHMVYSGNFDR